MRSGRRQRCKSVGITLTPGTTLRFGSLGFVYTRPMESVAGRTFTRPPHPNVLTGAAGHEAFVRGFSGDIIIGMLGPNPTQERFRLAVYYLTDLTFQASGDEPLGWGEFMERYTTMYPRGQPGLPNDPVMAYVNNLRTTGATAGSTTTWRAQTTRRHNPMRECNICVASSSSSSETEPAPRHCDAGCPAAGSTQRTRGGETPTRRGAGPSTPGAWRGCRAPRSTATQGAPAQEQPREGNGDRRPAQDVPVQGQPREGNGDQRERRPAADQPHGRAPTPPAHGTVRDNNQHTNKGANVDANAGADTPPLFRRCSRLQQHNKRRAPPRSSVQSAGGPEHHPPTS
jgi:hypothetical protein